MAKKYKNFIVKIVILLVALGLFAGGALIIWTSTLPMPDFDYFFEQRVVAQSTKIYDRTGEHLLYDVHENVRRTIIPLNEVSDYIKYATISIEDRDFYNHKGVKPSAILRAFIINLTSGTIEQGGSTITQQVVKNTLLTQDKKISRKLKEFVLALKVEQAISKDEILNIYLNETPYGGNIYGIEEAAKGYFGKEAKNLSLAESAYLAALPQAPTFLSPYGNNFDRLEARKNTVLREMRNNDFISTEEYSSALKEEVTFKEPSSQNIQAPHFVFFVLDELERKFGEEQIRNGGFQVITTLDMEAQKIAEDSIEKFAERNKEQFNAHNAGMVALDPKTGQILAMVGSVDYFDIENGGNFNTTLAERQPGSSFKPFVYAAALEKGYTTETVVFDLPTEFSTACTATGIPKTSGAECYSPVNYDNTYLGPVTFRQALAQSRNVPAVKVLYLAGLSNSIRLAQDLGITTLASPDRYGLTLVLGGGEVTPLEMTSAYGVFANEGARNPHTSILNIKDNSGNNIFDFQKNETQVIDKEITRKISNVLSDNVARTPAFGENSLLQIPGYDIAAKTGTTNDYKDAWIIGYTPEIAVGTWVGNNDNTSMEKRVAGFIVAPIWNNFMAEYLPKKTHSRFTRPEPIPSNYKPVFKGIWRGNERYLVDSISGGLATEFTPEELIEEKVLTSVHSILYWVNKNDPHGPKPTNPGSDPQFSLWEPPVRNWAASQGITDQSSSIIPDYEDDVHTEDSKIKVDILPLKKEVFEKDEKITVKLRSSSKIEQVDYFINSIYIGTVKDSLSFFFTPENIQGISDTNLLEVVAYDKNRNGGLGKIEFEVNN